MSPTPATDLLEALEDVLAAEGVHGVLRFLNTRAPHRFTGVYRFERPTLRNVMLFDRENPSLEVGSDAPVRETYCSITGSGRAPFFTSDAGSDSRLMEHPARESTISYCGVPLMDDTGEAVGTLCHFDLTARPVPHDEIGLLGSAAPLLLDALRAEGHFPARGSDA